ncbi:MAG: outer membrane protein assembly factor BamE [Sulfuricaulis sp.]
MNTKTMRHVSLLAAILLLSGCVNVYRLEIQQGNVVTQEMIDQLKPGLTRSQVRYVLGTPLVTDPFHPDRWDYYYYLRRSKDKTGESRHLTVFFKNDLLVTVQGDTRIKPNNLPATEPVTKPTGATPAPAAQSGTKLESVAPRVL